MNKSKFYKNKKPFNIDEIDVDKILVSTKEPYIKHLNTSLDIMIMMSFDHYI